MIDASMKSIRIRPATEIHLGQSVSFVLAVGSNRQVCLLKTTFKTQGQARSYLQKHRTALELAARSRLERGEIEDGVVQLRML
jgi:hypothetical protein